MSMRDHFFLVHQKVQQVVVDDGFRVLGFALVRGDRSPEFFYHRHGGEAAINELVRDSVEWFNTVVPPASRVLTNSEATHAAEFKEQMHHSFFAVVDRISGITGDDGFKVAGFALLRGDRATEFVVYHQGAIGGVHELVGQSEQWFNTVALPEPRAGGSGHGSGSDVGGSGSGSAAAAAAAAAAKVAASVARRNDPNNHHYNFDKSRLNRQDIRAGGKAFVFLRWELGSEGRVSDLHGRFGHMFGGHKVRIWVPMEFPHDNVAFLIFDEPASAQTMVQNGPFSFPEDGFQSIECSHYFPC